MSPMDTDGDAVEVDSEPTLIESANGDGAVLAPAAEPPDQVETDGDVLPEPEPEPAELAAEADALPEPEPEPEPEPAEADALPEPEPVFQPEEPDTAEHDLPDSAEPDLADSDDLVDPLITPPEMSQVLFVEVALILPATHPVVVLQEADPPFRELRIPVGGAEGIAIGYAARGIPTPRPLTHELFAKVLEEFGMSLDVVRITAVRGTAFTAEMVISGRLGARVIDCRPSDGIALALRQRLPVPIMVSPIVMSRAGTDPSGSN